MTHQKKRNRISNLPILVHPGTAEEIILREDLQALGKTPTLRGIKMDIVAVVPGNEARNRCIPWR